MAKMIEYSYAFDHDGRKVYNLAFGDYSLKTDSFSDHSITNNGDAYEVYRTVLSTIPMFFALYEDTLLMVRGSDSTKEFQADCRPICSRRCPFDMCRKAHLRVNIYRNYVDKNIDALSNEYEFLGSINQYDNQLFTETYKPGKKYLTILLKNVNLLYEAT